jgi:hypothetical protein
MFDTYGELLDEAQTWLTVRHPRQAGDSDFVHRQAVKAKALDALRGLLPAASLSNVGIYGSGQSYEMLLLRMRSHPLPEARRYADMMLEELRKVIPSFLQRVDRPERGGAWSEYLERTQRQTGELVEDLFPDLVAPGAVAAGPGRPVGGADGRADRLRSRRRGQGPRRHLRAPDRPPRGTGAGAGAVARGRGEAVVASGLRRRAGEPPPPAGTGLRAHRLPVRRGHRLRRVPRPAAPPHAHHRMAAARDQAGLRRARGGRRGRAGRPLRNVDGAVPRAGRDRSPRCSRWSPPTRCPWPTASAIRCR